MMVFSKIQKNKKKKLKNNISNKEVSCNDDGVIKYSKKETKAENNISNKNFSSNDDGVEKEPKKTKKS